MARTDQGNKLRTLTLQPGSRFTTTRAGLDTGSRTWLLDSEIAAKLEPALGSRDRVYTGMFLDSIETTFLENGVVQIVGNYLGIKNPNQPKPDVFEDGSDSEYSTASTVGSNNTYTFHRPKPRVTHIYLSKKKPDIMEVGSNIVPRGYPVSFNPDQAYGRVDRAPVTIVYSGWLLSSRNTRQAGLTTRGGKVYETTDVYTYEYLTVPEEEA